MFDTLTYKDENLPNLKQIIPELPAIPCFRHTDLQMFFKRLRINLARRYNVGNDNIRYLVTSEYGSKFGRPHYHLLLYCTAKITPLQLSAEIDRAWQLGRTDGIPYKTPLYVLQHNTYTSSTHLGRKLTSAMYVCKYIQKDCKLQTELDKRIRRADFILSSDAYPYAKSGSVKCSKIREKIVRAVNQFHLQSLGFGSFALRDLDLNAIFRNEIYMPSTQYVVQRINLPMYYKRKIFYELVEVNGSKIWNLTDFGKQYKNHLLPILQQRLAERLSNLAKLAHIDIDAIALADYVLNHRGRFKADKEGTLEERLANITHYLYVTRSDKENVGVGVSLDFIGNSVIGYAPLVQPIKIKDYIDKYIYLDSDYEAILATLYHAVSDISLAKQNVYSRLQELNSLYKR